MPVNLEKFSIVHVNLADGGSSTAGASTVLAASAGATDKKWMLHKLIYLKKRVQMQTTDGKTYICTSINRIFANSKRKEGIQ